MRKRLLAAYICIILISIVSCSFFIYEKSEDIYIETKVQDLIVKAELLEQILMATAPEAGAGKMQDFDDQFGIRVTIISSEADQYGEVLIDTQYNREEMSNHQYREEIKQALQGQISSAIRFSNTLKVDYLYVAVPTMLGNDNVVLRLAEPLSQINTLSKNLSSTAIAIAIVAIIVAVLVFYFSLRKLTKPLDEITDGVVAVSKGNYDVKLPHYTDKQFENLSQSFNKMVTEQKQYIDGLRIKNTEMAAILNSVGAGIVFLSNEQNIKMYNEQFIQLLELPKKDIGDLKLYELFRKTELMELVDHAIEQHQYDTQEIQFVLQRGTFIYKVTTAPVIDNHNIYYAGILLVIEDVTKLKNVDKLRREFVANVSHELKTPLTSIKGFVDTLKNGAMEDPQVAERFLSIIDVETDRLHRMIQQLLYLSKLENTSALVTPLKKSTQTMADELFIRFEKQAQEKNIALQIKVVEPFEYIGDQDGLLQILINLVDNAIQYSENGTVSIIFSHENNALVCTVEDQGIGIDKNELDRIFERFYRVEKSRAQKNGGTGLGLAIVKHLVENNHGTIQVSSQLGKGSCFIVTLPNWQG